MTLESLEQRALMSATLMAVDTLLEPQDAVVVSMDTTMTRTSDSSLSSTTDQTQYVVTTGGDQSGLAANLDEVVVGGNAGWIQFVDGVVGIYGTNEADTATVSYLGGFPGSGAWGLLVTLNNSHGPQSKIYPWLGVQNIEFFGYDGADSFSNLTWISSYAEGGNGNDSLWGGANADELRGGYGSDTIWGNGGADTVLRWDPATTTSRAGQVTTRWPATTEQIPSAEEAEMT